MSDREEALAWQVDVWDGISQTDWEEIAELIATSYCLIAPRRLAESVTSPPAVG